MASLPTPHFQFFFAKHPNPSSYGRTVAHDQVAAPPIVDLIVSVLYPCVCFTASPPLVLHVPFFPDGMCEDTAGYVDSQGLTCSRHIGYDCLDAWLYTKELGVESCLESCGLCESSGET